MNTLTTILAIVIGLIALLLIAAAFMSKQMVIERTVVIDKPKQEVFDYIRFVKNQDHFSKWNMTDPNMKKEYRGTDGEVGFVYSWNSETNNNVGAGEQEITKITPGESVEFEIRFKRPMENVAKGALRAEAVTADKTKVTWGFYGESKFPMNIMKGMLENMLGKDMALSLGNLKTELEKSKK